MTAGAMQLPARPAWPAAGVLLAGGLAIALGTALAHDAGAALLLAGAVVAPVLVWADARVGFGLLALALACNIDVLAGPMHVSLPQVLALALVAGCAVRRIRAPAGMLAWAAAGWLFLLACLPSLLRAASTGAALTGLLQFAVLAALLSAAVRWLCRRPDAGDVAVRMLVIGAALSVVPALAQVALGIGPASYRVGGLMRAHGLHAEPNNYAMYLVGVLPLALALLLRTRRGRWAVAAAAVGSALALTGSRGAWAGALAGLVAFWLTTFRLRARTLAAIGSVALGVAALAALVPQEFIAGRFALTDWSAQQRVLVLLTAWDGITRSPLLGWGPGAFAGMLPSLARFGLTDDVTMPHNLLLHIWFELGLLALVCFLGAWFSYVTSAWRAARRSGDALLAGLLAGATGMVAASMFGTLFTRGVQETFVLLIALTAAHIYRIRRGEAPDAAAVRL